MNSNWIDLLQTQTIFAFTYLKAEDIVALLHPLLAVVFVFPLIGMVANFAWQTRQRRLQTKNGKSKIPPVVGREHVQIGRWLTSGVVGVTLVALAYSVVFGSGGFAEQKALNWFQVALVTLLFIVTIASMILLYRARTKLGRGVFATLAGMGLVILGCQNGVYRLGNEWYWSHYYIGITAALLMIFSVAIVEDIYKDRKNRWRYAHVALNCFALLLFIGQGITGTRDLLEVPLSWQKPAVYGCNFQKRSCKASNIDETTVGVMYESPLQSLTNFQ
ncbi:DUF4079 domain-containing protein [Myxosarcina sp. GI1]|uniref:DUF4079 domain-containing protein n=1 Tax=Myxosarcina sp. GI1 TaxID=1541065 RepID=UPI0009DCBF67|nr:DUF4079 domain-containing protein [Myxosarcina sp. GI1]